jgi:hypothetical protein
MEPPYYRFAINCTLPLRWSYGTYPDPEAVPELDEPFPGAQVWLYMEDVVAMAPRALTGLSERYPGSRPLLLIIQATDTVYGGGEYGPWRAVLPEHVTSVAKVDLAAFVSEMRRWTAAYDVDLEDADHVSIWLEDHDPPIEDWLRQHATRCRPVWVETLQP